MFRAWIALSVQAQSSFGRWCRSGRANISAETAICLGPPRPHSLLPLSCPSLAPKALLRPLAHSRRPPHRFPSRYDSRFPHSLRECFSFLASSFSLFSVRISTPPRQKGQVVLLHR